MEISTVRDWVTVVVVLLNVSLGVILFVGRLQVKIWLQEAREQALVSLQSHNDNPSAHNNHAIAVSLELKFDKMMTRLGELTTQLAVLNARYEKD